VRRGAVDSSIWEKTRIRPGDASRIGMRRKAHYPAKSELDPDWQGVRTGGARGVGSWRSRLAKQWLERTPPALPEVVGSTRLDIHGGGVRASERKRPSLWRTFQLQLRVPQTCPGERLS